MPSDRTTSLPKKSLQAVAVLIGSVSSALSKWFLVWLFARAAGADAVGAYSAILAVSTPLFVVAQMGLRTIFLTSQTKWPWTTYMRLRILGMSMGGFLLALIVLFGTKYHMAIGLSVLGLKLTESMLDIYLARIQYANQMLRLGAIVTSSALMTALLAGTVVFWMDDVTYGIIAAALVSAIAAAWAWSRSRSVAYTPVETGSGTKAIVRASIPVTGAQFLASLLFQLPILALAVIADAGTIGAYAAASYLLTAAALLGATLQTLLITPFRRLLDRRGLEQLRRVSFKYTARTLGAGALAGIAVTCLGASVLEAIYGAGFGLDYWSLAYLSVAAATTVGAFLLSVTLTVMNKYKTVTFAMGSSCVVAASFGGILHLAGVPALQVASGMAAIGACARLVIMHVLVLRAK